MIRRALLAIRESRISAACFWLASGVSHIAAGMFLGAVLTSTAGASPMSAGGLDADWSKIVTLLGGLIAVYVALEKRLTSLEVASSAQRDLHAAQLREWVGTQLQALRDTLVGHGHRIDGIERQQERDAK